MNLEKASSSFLAFVNVIKTLRTPETGCPWDLEQDHKSLRPYLIEESHEVLEAIDKGNDEELADELGDVLLQVVLHAQIAEDRGAFDLTTVIDNVKDKMVRRHPHVFGDTEVSDSSDVIRNWEQIKLDEKKASETPLKEGQSKLFESISGIPQSLPALLRAQRIGEKATKIRFDWDSINGVVDKVQEEFTELQQELDLLPKEANHISSPLGSSSDVTKGNRAALEHELGDCLFSLCQLARWLGLNAEDALRACNQRFLSRFKKMDKALDSNFENLSIDQMEAAWQKAKKEKG
jgi:MazG family protein